MSDWLTRQEAAAHLKVSMRQLDRLGLPRSLVGHSPRYSQAALDAYLEGRMVDPSQKKRGSSPLPLPRWTPPRAGPTDLKAELKRLRRRWA